MRAAIAKSPAPAIASTDWTVALERGSRGWGNARVPGGALGGAGVVVSADAAASGDADAGVAVSSGDADADAAASGDADAGAAVSSGVADDCGARLSTASRARSAAAAEVDASHSSAPYAPRRSVPQRMQHPAASPSRPQTGQTVASSRCLATLSPQLIAFVVVSITPPLRLKHQHPCRGSTAGCRPAGIPAPGRWRRAS